MPLEQLSPTLTTYTLPKVPQSSYAHLSEAFVVRGFIIMITKVKIQEKIQKDQNSMTLTFALTFCMWTLKCRRAKNVNVLHFDMVPSQGSCDVGEVQVTLR